VDHQCEQCGKPIANFETFGNVNEQLCWDCYSEIFDAESEQEWYGVGPHKHDLSITGSIIGSTVHDDLSQYEKVNGWYQIEPGLYFWPDPDPRAAGCGIWRQTQQKPTCDYLPTELPGLEEG